MHIRKHSENLSSRQNTRQINVKRFIFDKYFLKMYDVEGFYNSLDIKKNPLLINLSVNFLLPKLLGYVLFIRQLLKHLHDKLHNFMANRFPYCFLHSIVLIPDNILHVNSDKTFNNNCIEKYIHICCLSFILCNF